MFIYLAFFFGCISLNFDTAQEFKDDGSSVLKTDDYLGINSAAFSSLSSLGSSYSTSSSGVLLELLGGYYQSEEYAEMLCDLIQDDAVKDCDPQEGLASKFNLS